MKKNTLTTAAIAIGAGAILALALPLSASAHIVVDPGQAEAGSYALITVRVPNESETAATNRVEVSLPTDTPFSSVRYVPVAGWSVELVRETLPDPVSVNGSTITEAVTSVIWTAEPGSEIGDGQLQEFPLSVGPVPDTGSIVLPAEQGYTDGTTVKWDETGDDAAKPAPVLFVNDAPVDHHGGHDDDDVTVGAQDEAAPASSSPDVLARVLGIGGLVLGAVGVVFGLTARRSATRK